MSDSIDAVFFDVEKSLWYLSWVACPYTCGFSLAGTEFNLVMAYEDICDEEGDFIGGRVYAAFLTEGEIEDPTEDVRSFDVLA